MEQLGNVLAAVVVFASLWLVRKLTKAEIHNEGLLGLKNDSLDDYERDLDKVFDYSKITTISLHQEEIVINGPSLSSGEEKVEENVEKGITGDDIPGAYPPPTNFR